MKGVGWINREGQNRYQKTNGRILQGQEVKCVKAARLGKKPANHLCCTWMDARGGR